MSECEFCGVAHVPMFVSVGASPGFAPGTTVALTGPPCLSVVRFVASHGIRGYEPCTMAVLESWFRTAPAGVTEVCDVGANVGVYATMFATAADHVTAIEPDRRLVDVMTASLPDSTSVVLGAAAHADSHVRLYLSDTSDASTSIRKNWRPSTTDVVVKSLTLDSLYGQDGAPPELVKLDVEGAEALALRGATRILRDVRPWLAVELNEEAGADEVRAVLEEYGYARRAVVDLAPRARAEDVDGNRGDALMYLCYPDDSAARDRLSLMRAWLLGC